MTTSGTSAAAEPATSDQPARAASSPGTAPANCTFHAADALVTDTWSRHLIAQWPSTTCPGVSSATASLSGPSSAPIGWLSC